MYSPSTFTKESRPCPLPCQISERLDLNANTSRPNSSSYSFQANQFLRCDWRFTWSKDLHFGWVQGCRQIRSTPHHRKQFLHGCRQTGCREITTIKEAGRNKSQIVQTWLPLNHERSHGADLRVFQDRWSWQVHRRLFQRRRCDVPQVQTRWAVGRQINADEAWLKRESFEAHIYRKYRLVLLGQETCRGQSQATEYKIAQALPRRPKHCAESRLTYHRPKHSSHWQNQSNWHEGFFTQLCELKQHNVTVGSPRFFSKKGTPGSQAKPDSRFQPEPASESVLDN